MLDALASIVQAALFAGILSSCGAVYAEATLGLTRDQSRHALRVMRRGAVAAIVAALSGALILVYRLGGEFDRGTLTATFLSVAGAAMSLQICGCIMLLAGPVSDPSARPMRLINSMIPILSFSFHGHVTDGQTFEPLLALVHVTAAAWWIGSLWTLHHACSREAPAQLAPLVRRFSSAAVKVVGALVMAGVMLALLLISTDAPPLDSDYLRVLAVKLVLVSFTLGMAAYNKFRLTPRLASGDPAAATALRAMIRNELILIAAVLLATSVLTTVTTPYVEYE